MPRTYWNHAKYRGLDRLERRALFYEKWGVPSIPSSSSGSNQMHRRNKDDHVLMVTRNAHAYIYAEQEERKPRNSKCAYNIERNKKNILSAGNSVNAVKSVTGRCMDALQMVFFLAYSDSDTIENHDNHPAMEFWVVKTFDPNDEHPGTVAKRLLFLEDKHGNLITQKHLDEVRKFLNSAFKELREL
ncbi:hypothetical protein APHAL10511_004346 [Amanita phalloides]|nr:hypothetical protein APHAL10511_004346 [Amanita phalloides]